MDTKSERVTFKRKAFRLGGSVVISVPSCLQIEPGTEITVTIQRPDHHR